mgnify:CR=1 FL=1
MTTFKIDYKNIYYPPGGILMWIIIFLELITFGMALVAFVFYGKEQPELFHQSRVQLNTTFGAINTIFLLSSGLCMANAVHEFKENNIQKSSLYFKLTMLGGTLFLLLKGIEYYHKIESGITFDTNMFFIFYWLFPLENSIILIATALNDTNMTSASGLLSIFHQTIVGFY